ncbi:saxitoxin and tetrodotoxin-binding protein 1-like [Mastacembelus armatus]|uniref:Saxitoxin and tetrodotoxin-binding protein 1-like n=1 Tax=Mastacembelus armatus TaxID=205130 RepID=A0A3Q3N8X2_9TELE|nr:saxitoxin and tetrodotoxin-binding protein 1-like [Mastacembelus armatus]
MCWAVKRAVLLLLVAGAMGSNTAPDGEECDHVKTRLPTKDLHKIFGDWVLVWSVCDYQQGWDLLPNVSSSHVELRLLPDNKTIMLNERNLYLDKSCSNYILNMSMPSDPSDTQHPPLQSHAATVERDGVVQPFNYSSEMDFYETCSDCLLLIYRSSLGRFLLSYRREGHHSDAEQLRAAHDAHRKQAECLGLPHDKPFSYDGAADFCHKKSSP